MTEAEHVKAVPPPSSITDQPFAIDDVLFAPTDDRRFERATRDGALVGEVLLDDAQYWFARKIVVGDVISDWKPMRSVHEARAFIVSKIRQ